MAVLVTGGYGHIGSWVCHDLIEEGKDVIVMGRSRHRKSYLEDKAEHITFYPADVLDYASIFRCFEQFRGKIDGIIHIAGLMGGPFFATNPHYHIRINTMGTVDMLEAARVFGIKRFIYISSGSVFGPRDDIAREDAPLTPGDLYGAAKSSSEFFGLQYANEFGIDFTAVRVYFAYGPGHFPSELYPLYNAIFGCLEGRTKISLPAGHDQAFDFTYVRDISRAVCLFYNAQGLKYRQYNTCSGWYATVPELITLVAKYAGHPVEIDVGPGRITPARAQPGLHTDT